MFAGHYIQHLLPSFSAIWRTSLAPTRRIPRRPFTWTRRSSEASEASEAPTRLRRRAKKDTRQQRHEWTTDAPELKKKKKRKMYKEKKTRREGRKKGEKRTLKEKRPNLLLLAFQRRPWKYCINHMRDNRGATHCSLRRPEEARPQRRSGVA